LSIIASEDCQGSQNLISKLASASLGIELTAVPPFINPKLIVEYQ